jgi:hypothetical protein
MSDLFEGEEIGSPHLQGVLQSWRSTGGDAAVVSTTNPGSGLPAISSSRIGELRWTFKAKRPGIQVSSGAFITQGAVLRRRNSRFPGPVVIPGFYDGGAN